MALPHNNGHINQPSCMRLWEEFHHGKTIDKEFKIESVQLASKSGSTLFGIERDLGFSQRIIRRWKHDLLKDGEQAFPEKGHVFLSPSDVELRRYKREYN